MSELDSKIADTFSVLLRSEATAIIREVFGTQGAERIRHSLYKQIDDIVGYSLRVQAVKIVKSTVFEEADEVLKVLVGSLFPPTPKELVHNETVWKMSTVVFQVTEDHTGRHNLAPGALSGGAPSEVVMVAGAPAPPLPPGSRSESDDFRPSSPCDRL